MRFLHAMRFRCTVEHGTCTAWIQLAGELDLATAPVLHRHLQEALAHARLVVLDLRQLSFIDAAGLQVIYAASESAAAQERRLMLIRGPRVDRVFTLTGLSEKLVMFDVAAHEGNLERVHLPLSAPDVMPAVTAHGGGRVQRTASVRSHANTETTLPMPQAPRFSRRDEAVTPADGDSNGHADIDGVMAKVKDPIS